MNEIIDTEHQKRKVEELKRKILAHRSLLYDHGGRGEGHRAGDGESAMEKDVLVKEEERREDIMWEGRSHTELDADQIATEAGQRRLEALEFELRDEENRRLQERARLRAEELKKRNQEPERKRAGEVEVSTKNTILPLPESDVPSKTETNQVYREVLLLAYREGALGKTEEEILSLLRMRLGVTEKEHVGLAQKVRLEIYSQAMADVWEDGVVTKQESDRLDLLRDQLNVTADEHLRLERLVRREALRRQSALAS
jgi:hypothetical protein